MYQFNDEKEFAYMWRNNGLLPAGEPGEIMLMKDAISVPNVSLWLPKIMQNIVKEAAEPYLIGTSLLQRVEYHFGQTITFPAVGALEAADIAEGMPYPEKQVSVGGATVTASIGKSGVAIKITDEVIRYNQYDVLELNLRAAGRALARHKEKKIFNHILSLGVVCFDNLNPTSSAFGVTHGRALGGTANGSVIVDDLFDTYGQILMQGFTPDTLLMHPLTWTMFVKDPIMRSIALAGGNGTFFATHQGNPAGRAPWDASNQGKLGYSSGQSIAPGANAGSETPTALEGYDQNIRSAPSLPGYFPYPFRIIVSPFAPYNPVTKLTDIMMFDSSELGALIVDEDIMTEEWTDPSVDIKKVKMRERYGVGIFNQGLGIGLLRNVKVIPNEVVLPAQTTQSVSGTISAIPATTPVV